MANSRRANEPISPNRMMIRRTLFLMTVCGIVAFMVLAFRLFQIQILDHEKYETAAVEQQVRQTTVAAQRGTIYDRNMNILAMSATVSTIYISPAEISMYDEDPELIARGLSEILGVDYDKILEKTKNTSSWYSTVAVKVEDDVAEQVRAFKEQYDLKGVKIEEATKRYYPYSSLACHVIGFVGTDDYGLSGIEYACNSILSGTDGRIIRATNANGTDMLFTDFEDYYDAEDGESVVLTIDSNIQYYLEKYISLAIKDYDVQNGAAGIVMDVNTGEVLAMASFGGFDLNNYQTVSDETQTQIDAETDESVKSQMLTAAQTLQWRNKAISDTYEPGSTFKIITLAMALEEGEVNLDSTFYCSGSQAVLGRSQPVKCWKSGGHGSETLTQAVMNSCNVAFVQIGLKVGEENFYKYAKAFGFFDETGIDLPGESNGIWWPEDVFFDKENLSQLAAASFGQTFTITPIQLITAVSAVANGGNLMQPYLVKQVLDQDGNVVSQTTPTAVRQVISAETSKTCCEILEQVVSGGTGKNAYVAGYRIAGKTGTSEKVNLETQTGEKQYFVSFIGFAPADDPQIAVLVILDTPSSDSGIYISGGQMAAPVVGNIMSALLPYLGVQPEYTDEEEEAVDKVVPDLTGLSLTEAQAELNDAGLSYRVSGSGDVVTGQMPAANASVAAGSEIVLYCGREPDTDMATVPDLTGMNYQTARDAMAEYGLYICEEGSILPGDTVTVISQYAQAGSELEKGSVVAVVLSDSSNLGRY